ncbi:MAG TPA: hypothetical protein DHV36_02725 [Desulfobacteraceae bacterium]|nr:hypothetical protein [Desulfobacteraceae bacterium]
MKRKLDAIIIAAATCLIVFGLSAATLAQDALQDASDLHTIHIITPEWEAQTNRDGSGLFFEIVQAVYAPSGIHIKPTFAPWKRCQATVDAKKADAMLCVWKTHAAEHGQLIPDYPMFIERTAVVFKRASLLDWHGVNAMDYKRAVWLRGYNYHTDPHLASVQLVQWHEVDSHEEAWQQLNLDRFDFYIDALIDLDTYIQENNIDMGLYRKVVLWSQKSYVAFADTPKSRRLIDIYNRELPKLIKNGTLEMILEEYGQTFHADEWQ